MIVYLLAGALVFSLVQWSQEREERLILECMCQMEPLPEADEGTLNGNWEFDTTNQSPDVKGI